MLPDRMDAEFPLCVMLSVPTMEPSTSDPGGKEIFAVTVTSSTCLVMVCVCPAEGPGDTAPSGVSAMLDVATPVIINVAPSAMLSGTRIFELITARPLVQRDADASRPSGMFSRVTGAGHGRQ
jgi:hypothetical protein